MRLCNALLLFRILQGFGGGGMVPVAQSILADVFPPEKRGQAFALFGVAVVVAPVVGPTLGGWISDNWSWQWCFLINAPVGVLAMALIAVLLSAPKRQQSQQQSHGFDVIGFVLVATFLGALEVVLDRGLEDDWFASGCFHSSLLSPQVVRLCCVTSSRGAGSGPRRFEHGRSSRRYIRYLGGEGVS